MTFKIILAALLSLAPPSEDRAMAEVAAAVSKQTNDARLIAFTLSWGWHESRFSKRIINCQCKRWECDAKKLKDGTIHFRAKGGWQAHERGAPRWDELCGSVDLQAEQALRHARWAISKCSGDVRCSFRLLGGIRRDVPLKGEADRVASFDKIRGQL